MMKTNIEKLKTAKKWEHNFTPKQADIDFLIEAFNAIEKLQYVKAQPKQILAMLQNCKNAFSFMINKSIPTETIELCFEQYIKHLSDCSVYFLSEAFDNIIKTKKFFPCVAEILEATEEVEREYWSLRYGTHLMIEDFQVRILPRTKEFLKSAVRKPAKEKSEREISYIKFMQENFLTILEEVELECWNEHKAKNSSD